MAQEHEVKNKKYMKIYPKKNYKNDKLSFWYHQHVVHTV